MGKFRLFLEEVQNINSDKEVKLQDYKVKVDYYNHNKDKFLSIITTKSPDIWEQEANKIIKGNPYLGSKWKLDKLTNTIKKDEDKVKSNELTDAEVKEVQQDILNNKQELNKLKNDIAKRIQEDLHDIQRS